MSQPDGPTSTATSVDLGSLLERVRQGKVTGRGYLKITPPLSIDVDAVLEAVQVVRECLHDLITDRDKFSGQDIQR